jgi:hypothetical protein
VNDALPASSTRDLADPGSFRDPGSRVYRVGETIYRALDERAAMNWKALRATRFFEDGVAAGTIIGTEPAEAAPGVDGWAEVVRHDTVPVISYPYEWTFSMLKDAALLQLDLLLAALAEDMILKDSTPYNVQFIGSRPVFIDIGSFERLEPGDVWVGYRQFLQQFLYPLMLTARVGVPFQPWLRGRMEGLTADEMSRMLGPRDHLRKSSLLHVSLPARSERRYEGDDSGRDVRSELQQAGFSKDMIVTNVEGLRRVVTELTWDPDHSRWDDYVSCAHVSGQREFKADFVTRSLLELAPDTVWDLGTNDGHFARLAGVTTDRVVAFDADHLVLDHFYRALRLDAVDNVLPLLYDLTDPSPGLGWRGAERRPLAARSTPDLVLCLAVVHHLVIGRNVPLRRVVDWLADLGAHVVFEWVPPDDPMVRGLTANKRPHEVHGDYEEQALRHLVAERLTVTREEPVPGSSRILFALSPKT